MGPLMAVYFTIVEAFIVPDKDALDNVLHSMSELEQDLTFFRAAWENNGKPDVPVGMTAVPVDDQGLRLVLEAIGLHASKTRIHRLFKDFDQNGDGEVDAGEVVARLQRMPK